MQSGHPYGDTNNNNNHNNTAPSYPMSSQAGPVSMPISSPSASSSSSTAAAGHNGSASLNQIHRLTASASPISRPPLNPFTNHANHHQMMQQQKQQRDHRMQMQHVQQQQQQVQQQNHMQTAHSDQPYCCKCNRLITDRHLLRALEQYWHEDCLKCNLCDARLGEVGSTLYQKADMILCKRDYLRMFGCTGKCSACDKPIPAFELVMRARHNNYHLECFACEICKMRFCVGDKFYLSLDNRVLCEHDMNTKKTAK